MFPRRLASLCASDRQGKILEMQRAQIILELLRSHRSGCKGFPDTALKRGGKSLSRNFPAARLRLGIEPFQKSGLSIERTGEIH